MREAIDKKSQDEGRRWSRLPKFTADEVKYVHGTADFIALNYYSSNLVTPFSLLPDANPADSDNEIQGDIDPNWPQANSSWLFSVPEGLYELLKWFRDQYDNARVYIVENGWSGEKNSLN
jgi:beta-glucosidase/6-phospho-beta-glucosidase/beta-galactosidase